MKITLSYGGGGKETNKLINELFYKYFDNEILTKSEDAAIIEGSERLAFTTDSFTVSPIFFNGGDIGKLSVVGTCNDLAMMGAKPKYLTCGFMIEEGLEFDELEKIVKSMAEELKKTGAKIVAGDTKVVPAGSVDKIFINTSGIGEVIRPGISASNLKKGDKILVSGDIGRHGTVIMAHRYGVETELKSDCKLLWDEVKALIDAGLDIKALRDATRGGISAVLNEWSEASGVGIEIEEEKLPISDEVVGLCEIFGFEPMDLANEGTFIVAVSEKDALKAEEILKSFNQNASIIGEVTDDDKVILKSPWGTKRVIELPKGELLPRIC
ncbi:hydrogenase expression/formation protein HypE [Caminibacter pacificus]|uniref:Hydrogenase expression/formation protein HypE n=1 Tax=Caminibacter pacificus TaxID=1424653 RepID=A0AAJ4RDC5_9BACT|nr:hydrogenase expression/formation protein HypE [Caminibacter pacificus]QCI28623.1 hydrogenase expression/formation protein HypE [Caminibacter pacificus]ROR40648.1 hydrogenase maturation carbamoyl dehydratase HypE [Caminibacter pacificus]